MRKVKDSYNCDALSLAAGVAALEDQVWMRANRERILTTRRRTLRASPGPGLRGRPQPGELRLGDASRAAIKDLYEQLKARKILVRYMQFPEVEMDGLRITVGTDAEIDQLLEVLAGIL